MYGVPLQPTLQAMQALHKQQQQQTQGPQGLAARGSGSSDDDDEGGSAAADALVASDYRGDSQPVSHAVLAQQARAAAIALVRFGGGIPPARKEQLERVVAAFAGRCVCVLCVCVWCGSSFGIARTRTCLPAPHSPDTTSSHPLPCLPHTSLTTGRSPAALMAATATAAAAAASRQRTSRPRCWQG
jgi:hypothetical protein